MLFGLNNFTPFKVISFLVGFVIVNIIVFMTFFSSDQIIPPPKNFAGKYTLGTTLSMIKFSCSRWLLEVLIGDKVISCGQTVPLIEFSELVSVKFSRAKDVSTHRPSLHLIVITVYLYMAPITGLPLKSRTYYYAKIYDLLVQCMRLNQYQW